MHTEKDVLYRELVAARKACRACSGLTNPAACGGGTHDSDHIGPWSLWQGNLDAELMIIGQDWGDENYFLDNAGRESRRNPTNECLRRLLGGIGIEISSPSDEPCGGS